MIYHSKERERGREREEDNGERTKKSGKEGERAQLSIIDC